MLHLVSNKPDLPELEKRILEFWREERIFQKSIDQRASGPLYTLYEGPPTVNASPGIHHVLSRVFKDVFPRYKAMQGYRTPRNAGWDTHGLPVELGIEEELGFSSKTDIEAYGIDRFNKRCRESVSQHIGEWNDLTERIGFWIDLDHPYITFDNSYIESCWWLIKQLWDKGLIYKGYRVTPHCPRCGTSLSSHEVALGYKDDTPDPSIFVRFRITSALPDGSRPEVPTYLLAWTTTPWTLTANVALAVNSDETYVLVQTISDERLILAKALADQALGHGNWETLREFTGSELAGTLYERLFEPRPEFVVGGGDLQHYNRVVRADFVSMEDGTGIVHIAPAYGQEDYDLGQSENLPVVHTVDLGGHLLPVDKPWDGKFVKAADSLILDDLKSRGLLYRQGIIRHTYPFCWRCDTPLVYYAKPSWYVKTTVKKDVLIEANEGINWYPGHIKRGRFGDWLQNNVDWAFSRERYWGTPLPIWQCDECGERECIGGYEELKTKPNVSGITDDPDFHRPYVDEISFNCTCGKTMHRVPEVIDCWFDSGAMPFAQRHYPFENGGLLSDGRFPADFICEAVDQTRGWFYSLHAIAVILFDQPCYKNVICLGHILDADGEKMSKSKGNVVEPWEVINSYGADALRWYLITSSPPGNVRRFSIESISEGMRRFLLTLWNTYSFFTTYATIDGFDPRETESLAQRSELDRWILSELHQLTDGVTKSFDQYDATTAGRKIEGFVDDLSNWYIRRSRRRFWKSESDTDKQSAHATLYECLTTIAKLLAPITPFIAEEIYQNLVCSYYPEAPKSVHLADFPIADRSGIDAQLSQNIRLVMKVTSLGRSARSKAGIKVRQPLERAIIKVKTKSEAAGLKELSHQIIDELNIKEMLITTDEREVVHFEVKPNLALLGPKYGHDLPLITSALAEIDASEVATRARSGKDIKTAAHTLLPDEILISTVPLMGYAMAEDGEYIVSVHTGVSSHLADEGLVREIVHRLQIMRRSAGFDIADYIETRYEGGDTIKRVMHSFASYIKQETLSRELSDEPPPEGAYVEQHRVDGIEVTLAVKR